MKRSSAAQVPASENIERSGSCINSSQARMWEATVGTTDLCYLKLVTSNADIKETIRFPKPLSQQDFFSHNTNRHEVL